MDTVFIAITSAFRLDPEFTLEQIRVGLTDEIRPAVAPGDITLVSPDLKGDILHTDSIPLAEFEYLKEHPPLGVLELLRKVRALGHGETVDAALLIAINMISALNAVKVVGEAADPHADANWQALRFAVDIIDNTLPEWEMLEITPEDAKRHRERLVAMQDTELANKPFERYDSTLGDHEGYPELGGNQIVASVFEAKRVFTKIGEFAEGVFLYVESVPVDPERPLFLFNVGTSVRVAADFDDAVNEMCTGANLILRYGDV